MTTRINGIAMDGSEPVGASLPTTLLIIGGLFLIGCAALAWPSIAFIAASEKTRGQVVGVDPRDHRAQVFVFTPPDGAERRVTSRALTEPPCCEIGEIVWVRYRPDNPMDARIASLQDFWLWPGVLGGFGLLWFIPGLVALRAHLIHRRRPAEAVVAAPRHRRRPGKAAAAVARPPGVMVAQPAADRPPVALRLAGLRRAETPSGPRWFVQARWTGPDGAERMFESDPLPFDPVPQMRDMASVTVAFDPGDPNGAYAMDLSFLVTPEPRVGGFRA